MQTINATNLKSHCLSVLNDVKQTGETFVITKHGKPIAKIVPFVEEHADFSQRKLFGSGRVLGDIVSPILDPDDIRLEEGLI